MNDVVLHGGQLIDGLGGDPQGLSELVIQGGGITAIRTGGAARTHQSGVVDVSGLTVLPGLIDAHTHMGGVAGVDTDRLTPAMTAALLFRNAELCLMSGHTTAREVGGADGALRQVIDAGHVPGPRLRPSGPLLCQSGGHGDFRRFQHDHSDVGTPGLVRMSQVVDGPDQMRIAARDAFRRGATQLKVCISGGVISVSDRLEDVQFTVEELRAAVVEAEARGTYVTAHAMTSESIRHGLEAGLRCFEHGAVLDHETAEALVEADAALVSTLAVAYLLAEEWQAWGVPEESVPRLKGKFEECLVSLQIATEAGVRVGSGTDLLGPEQNRRGLELVLKAGVIGPMRAIESATRVNAEILGMADEVGILVEGKLGDVIAVSGDPLTEPALLDDPDRVVLVIKGGEVVKDLRNR